MSRLKNINIDLFKNSKGKLKLCALGVGIIMSIGATGCTSPNNTQNLNTELAVEDLLEEKSTLNLEYEGVETIPESDLLTFTKLDTNEMLGIATTDSEDRKLQLPPGEYGVLSDYLEYQEFSIEKGNQSYELHADYTTRQVTVQKASTKGVSK